jgi:hypothetical protein
LIALYSKHGYVETARHMHDVTGTPMVKLERIFAAASSDGESA